MKGRNLILTGLPRSGTTLLCKLLGSLPETVALHEPMDVTRFPALDGPSAIIESIAEFMEQNRRSLLNNGQAISKQMDGTVPTNPFANRRALFGRRKERTFLGTIQIDKPLSEDFTLAIKHPSAFMALLEHLPQHFEVFATVRNPLSVLSSWNSVVVPVSEGHAPAAEELDPELKAALARIPGRMERQLHLMCWFMERLARFLPRERVIRYEDVILSGGRALEVVTARAAQLDEPLENRNSNKIYDRKHMQECGAALLALGEDAPVWRFYSRNEVESLIP